MPGSDTSLASPLGRLTFSSVVDLFLAYVVCASHIAQGVLVKVEKNPTCMREIFLKGSTGADSWENQ